MLCLSTHGRFVPEADIVGPSTPASGGKLKPASPYAAIVLNERLRCPRRTRTLTPEEEIGPWRKS